jgi:hypothetical protein
MSLIKITQRDIDKSKPPEAGWHLGKIESFTEEDSKDKKSKNWVFEIVITADSDQNGRYMYARFNSKAPGMLVSSGFLSAALELSPDQLSEMEFNPTDLLGKALYGNVTNEVYEGKIQKRTNEFAPASKPPF